MKWFLAFVFSCMVAYGAEDKISVSSPEDFTPGLKQSGTELKMDSGAYYYSKKRLTIDPSRKYRLRGEFKLADGSKPIRVIFSADQYTEDGHRIAGCQVWTVPGTETELTAPVKKGDKILCVKDVSSWDLSNVLRLRTAVVAFNVDKTGKQADLPNFEVAGGIVKVVPKEGFTELELKDSMRKAYPKDTPVRLHLDRSFFGIGSGFLSLNNHWKKVDVTIMPMNEASKTVTDKQLWPGSAKLGILLLPWPLTSFPENSAVLMRNLELSEIK